MVGAAIVTGDNYSLKDMQQLMMADIKSIQEETQKQTKALNDIAASLIVVTAQVQTHEKQLNGDSGIEQRLGKMGTVVQRNAIIISTAVGVVGFVLGLWAKAGFKLPF